MVVAKTFFKNVQNFNPSLVYCIKYLTNVKFLNQPGNLNRDLDAVHGNVKAFKCDISVNNLDRKIMFSGTSARLMGFFFHPDVNPIGCKDCLSVKTSSSGTSEVFMNNRKK